MKEGIFIISAGLLYIRSQDSLLFCCLVVRSYTRSSTEQPNNNGPQPLESVLPLLKDAWDLLLLE